MNFLVLGALEVRTDGTALPLKAPKLQAVLASLLINVNSFVSVEHLFDYVWGDLPPAGARATLQTYVYRLRRLLSEIPDVDLQTDTAGYTLDVPAASIDLGRFREHVGRASDHAGGDGQLGSAVGELRAALSLWRGRTLANIHGERLQQEAQFIDHERLTAHEELLSIEIALGNHRRVIPELCKLVVANPFREALAAQLMLALYRSGQQAEALKWYAATRHRLREELGIEPGPELQSLQRAILGRTPPERVQLSSWTDRMQGPTATAARSG